MSRDFSFNAKFVGKNVLFVQKLVGKMEQYCEISLTFLFFWYIIILYYFVEVNDLVQIGDRKII